MDVREIGQHVLHYCREQGWAGLETGISRPVPRMAEGEIELWYLLYRSQVRPPHQILYSPFAHVGVSYPSGQEVSHSPLPNTDSSQPLGRYPHDAAKAIPPDQWEAVWEELFDLYPTVITAFANGISSVDQQEQIARFSELFMLTTPPFMMEHYRALNPAFFDWLEKGSE